MGDHLFQDSKLKVVSRLLLLQYNRYVTSYLEYLPHSHSEKCSIVCSKQYSYMFSYVREGAMSCEPITAMNDNTITSTAATTISAK